MGSGIKIEKLKILSAPLLMRCFDYLRYQFPESLIPAIASSRLSSGIVGKKVS